MPECPFFLLSEGKFDDASCKITKYNNAITIKYKDLEQKKASKIWLTGKRTTWTNLYHVSLLFRYSSSRNLSIIQIVQAEEGSVETIENEDDEQIVNRVGVVEKVASDQFDACTLPKCTKTEIPKPSPRPCTQPSTDVPETHAQVLVLSPAELIHEHESCGHPGFNKIRAQHGMPTLPSGQLPKCYSCQKWKDKAPLTKLSCPCPHGMENPGFKLSSTICPENCGNNASDLKARISPSSTSSTSQMLPSN